MWDFPKHLGLCKNIINNSLLTAEDRLSAFCFVKQKGASEGHFWGRAANATLHDHTQSLTLKRGISNYAPGCEGNP